MTRIRLCLDGQWDFYPDPDQSMTHRIVNQPAPYTITVPGPWQSQVADLRDYSGIAWYRRSFTPPTPPTADCTAILHFGAVDYHTTVWLNGQYIGEHEGGYLPFEFVLDHALRSDQPNELVVRVLDPDDDTTRFPAFPFAEIPHGKQSWYGPIGGIWQSVYLETRPTTHITRLRITPQVPLEQVEVTVSLNQPVTQPSPLCFTITDPQGRRTDHRGVVVPGASHAQTTLPLPNPLLWDTEHPHLYQLEATLLPQSGAADTLPVQEGDTLCSTFGMRTIAAAPTGHLLLNGRLLYLRGALDQDYYPDTIYTPLAMPNSMHSLPKPNTWG